ncbi:MAG: glycosyltransferase [Spirochaetia bacterium]
MNIFAILLYITFAIAAGIWIFHTVVIIGLVLARKKQHKLLKKEGTRKDLFVSVIIPARDEIENLPDIFSCLQVQSYINFEIILVNDRSRDGTDLLIENYAKQNPRIKVKTVHNHSDPGKLNPKQHALSLGIQAAEGEVLLFTDADCHIGPNWIKSIIPFYEQPDIGIVFSSVAAREEKGVLKKFQVFDHLFRYCYTDGAAGLGMPTGGFGNNLAIRRKTLEEIGGITNIPYSVTEDAALIASVRERTNWKILSNSAADSQILVRPQDTWTALEYQEIRWNAGGLFSPDITTRLAYSYVMYFLTVSVIALPFSLFYPIMLIYPATSFFTMCGIGLSSAVLSRKSLLYWLSVPLNVVIAMGFYSFVTIRTIFSQSVRWKGRTLQTHPLHGNADTSTDKS